MNESCNADKEIIEQQISSLRKELEIALSQEELDRLFFRDADEQDSKKERIKKEKIAKRNEHSKELLEEAKKNIRNQVCVVKDSTSLSYKELEKLKLGDSILLNSENKEEAEILVNGELFARGKMETVGGIKSIKITWLKKSK